MKALSALRTLLLVSIATIVASPARAENFAAQPQQNDTSAQKQSPEAAGTGVSGTHATGVTGTSAAGAHDNHVLTQANAKPAVGPSPAPPHGDAKAGAQIAASGVPEKGAAPCTSCHGANGEGNSATGFPRLAGLPEAYLAKQLDDYVGGGRTNPIMTPIAKGLSSAQRHDVAAFYASSEPPAAAATTAPQSQPADAARARTLARRGDEVLHVQACANCHGPDGSGLPPSYPGLAAQVAKYLSGALGEWRSGSRNNDPSGQMPMIAKSLSDADIAALAALYAALPPSSATSSIANTTK